MADPLGDWLRANRSAFNSRPPVRDRARDMTGYRPGTVSPGAGGGARGSAESSRAYLERLAQRNQEIQREASPSAMNDRGGDMIANSGTATSRAYANAHGSQAVLGVPNSTNATQGQLGYGLNPSRTPQSPYNGVGSGGGSGMGGSAVEEAGPVLPTRTDLGPIYQELLKTLLGYGDTINKDFSASEKFIRDQYDRSNVGLTGNFSNANKNLEMAKAGLGYGDTSAYQQNMNQITENADLSETADLTYLEKMRGARGIEMKDIAMQIERDRIAQQNAQDLALQEAMLVAMSARSGGGSGGGGGRGGRGGSGSTNTTGSETATETMTLNDPGVQAEYEYLLQTNPEAAAIFAENYQASMGSPLTRSLSGQIGNASKRLTPVQQASKLPVKKTGLSWVDNPVNRIIGTAKKSTAAQRAAIANLEAARRAANDATGSGLRGTPSVTRKVSTTAKRTNPRSYTPTKAS